jgi:lipoprotein-releasing system permease protein
MLRRGLISGIAGAMLMARWRQSLVAAVGVMFSITMFVTLLGFMTGLNDLLDGLILNRSPHVRLYRDIRPSAEQPLSRDARYRNSYALVESVKPNGNRMAIYNGGAILQTLRQDPRVQGVAPKISAQVFYQTGAIELTGLINGVEPEAENRFFHFGDYVRSGKAEDLSRVPNSIILGKGVADKTMARIGDIIQVVTAAGDRVPLKVVGFFQSGLMDIDKVQSYTSIGTARKLLGKDNQYVTDLQVKLHDVTMAPALAIEYRKRFETDAEDIQTANSQFETGSSVRSIISYAVGITLLVVAGFGIYNILNMMIYEKMDSIAILKATGFSGKDVNRIFILIAVRIGAAGGAAGLVTGYLLSSAIDRIPFNTAALPTVTTYPINYNPKFYIIALSFALITTILAGWFPARKASKVDPVSIIRGK